MYRENSFFVTNYNAHTIVKVSSSGIASIFAGGDNSAGHADGVGINARFNSPNSLTIDQQSGNIFVSDQSNHSIRKITPHGEVSTIAGSGQGFTDGTGKAAKFNNPFGICFDEDSLSLVVCDYSNRKLRRVKLNGEVTTICDVPSPRAVAMSSCQSIFVVGDSHKLYKVTHLGAQRYEVVVLAGNGNAQQVDGRADECSFSRSFGIAVHEPSNTCFISDNGSNAIRKVSFSTPLL